jgi:hypothetical protein
LIEHEITQNFVPSCHATHIAIQREWWASNDISVQSIGEALLLLRVLHVLLLLLLRVLLLLLRVLLLRVLLLVLRGVS